MAAKLKGCAKSDTNEHNWAEPRKANTSFLHPLYFHFNRKLKEIPVYTHKCFVAYWSIWTDFIIAVCHLKLVMLATSNHCSQNSQAQIHAAEGKQQAHRLIKSEPVVER